MDWPFLALIIVALTWGITNPLIKRGSAKPKSAKNHSHMPNWLAEAFVLLGRPTYVLPLALNLAGSVLFYVVLQNAKLTMVTPIANSLTLVITTVAGIAFGDPKPSPRSPSVLDQIIRS